MLCRPHGHPACDHASFLFSFLFKLKTKALTAKKMFEAATLSPGWCRALKSAFEVQVPSTQWRLRLTECDDLPACAGRSCRHSRCMSLPPRTHNQEVREHSPPDCALTQHGTGSRLPAQWVQAPALGTLRVGSEPGLRIGMELPLTPGMSPSFCLPRLSPWLSPQRAGLSVSCFCACLISMFPGSPWPSIPCCDCSPASLLSVALVSYALSPSMSGRTSERSWDDQCLAE